MKKNLIILVSILFWGCTEGEILNDSNIDQKSKMEVAIENSNPSNEINEEIPPINIDENDFKFSLKTKKKMPFPSYDFGAELYNGKIYAFLGTEDHLVDWNKSYGKVCVYDLENDSWKIVNDIPKYQSNTTSTIVGDKIYLIGAYGFKKTIQVYNITQNKWEKNLSLPIGLYWSTAETFNSKIYIIGGYAEETNGNGVRFLSTVQIYDTKTGQWSFGNEMPSKIQSPNSLVFNGEIYVWDLNLAYKYSPKNNIWTTLDKLQSYTKSSQEGIVINDYLLFTSGQNGSGFSDKANKKIHLYNTITNNYIKSATDLMIGRHYNYNLFSYKNKVYVLGGREDQEWNAMDEVIEISFE